MKHLRQHHRGFTLIESMMASVVLAFSVVGLAGVMLATARNAEVSNSQISATDVARNDMETLAASRLSDLSPAIGASTTEIIPSTSLSTTSQPVTHAGQISYVSRSVTQGLRDLAVVKVVVTTQGGETVTLQRLVTRAEISE